jgi:hypothetical protein
LLGEGPHCCSVVEDKDEVRQLETDLPSETSTACTYGRRCAPRPIGEPGDDDAIAISSGSEEAGLDNREDCETLCALVSIFILYDALQG